MQTVNDLQTPIGEILQRVGSDGILLQTQGNSPFALMPLDEELLDFLIERNPGFIDECRQIRQRMAAGHTHSQEEVNAMFGRKTAS